MIKSAQAPRKSGCRPLRVEVYLGLLFVPHSLIPVSTNNIFAHISLRSHLKQGWDTKDVYVEDQILLPGVSPQEKGTVTSLSLGR